MGGKVVESKPPEIGVLDINIEEAAKADHIFDFLPNKIKALQWHSYEVVGLETNPKVKVIGTSPSTKYQIFGFDNYAYGIQFHFRNFEKLLLMIGLKFLNIKMLSKNLLEPMHYLK